MGRAAKVRSSIYLPLAVLLAVGAGLRALTMVTFSPAFLTHPGIADSALFVGSASGGLYEDPTRPAGYPMFLRALSYLSSELSVTIGVQHGVGLIAALLLYLTVRRAGGPRWLGLIPAGVLVANGDQIFLEHTLLSESLFTLLVTGSLYAAVRCVGGDHRHWPWLVAVGGLLAASAIVRSVGLILIPVVLVWLLLALPGRWPGRILQAGAVGAVAVSVLAGDAIVRSSLTEYAGFSPTSGRSLYARVAQFADCGEFDTPAGTSGLCEKTPARARPGPTFYFSFRSSPAHRVFGPPPNGDGKLGAFARRAILHQPVDYITTVTEDVARYVDPARKSRAFSGLGPGSLDFDQPPAADRQTAEAVAERLFSPVTLRERRAAGAVGGYQEVARVHGWLLPVAFMVAAAGLLAATGRVRLTIALAGGTALGLLLLPSATLIFGARYAVPPLGPLATAAGLGGWALVLRLRGRHSGGELRPD
jgi:hypothetical protein